jgi:ferric-dicitrate binding protein FerR (iron transport regulator)
MAEVSRTELLIQKFLDGTASDADLAELDRLLADHPAAADALADATRLDALLALHFGMELCVAPHPDVSPVGVPQSSSYPQRHRGRWRADHHRRLSAIAACVVLIFGLYYGLRPGHTLANRVVSGRVFVNGILATTIPNGSLVEVAGDTEAVVQLADGSRAKLAPRTEAVLRGPVGGEQIVELSSGTGQFEVQKGAGRFRVETPVGSVTALGTEFSVELRPAVSGFGESEMRTNNMVVMAVAVLVGMVQVDLGGISQELAIGQKRIFAADKGKGKDGLPLPSGDLLGFTGKGNQPMALEQTFPGINGALLLTEEQKRQIFEVREQILGSDAVKAAGQKAKLDPNATESQKEEARRTLQEARSRLQQKVGDILTADQKALVTRINAASEEAHKAAYDGLEPQLVGAKGNADQMAELQRQLREKRQSEMAIRLAAILSADQQAAYQKAAAEQKAAEERAKNAKKPIK